MDLGNNFVLTEENQKKIKNAFVLSSPSLPPVTTSSFLQTQLMTCQTEQED